MTDLRVYRDDSEILTWKWEAHYLDGTVLKQTDDNGVFHKIKEIDQEMLASFHMVSVFDLPPIIMLWKEKRKLIHFTRVSHLNMGTENELIMRRYFFGYEDKYSKVILCIMPDGGIIISNDENIKVNFEVENVPNNDVSGSG